MQAASKIFPRHGVPRPGFDGIQPSLNFTAIDGGPQHPSPQQALAHRRRGGIQRAEEGAAGIFSAEQRLDQLQIANRYRV